MREADIKAVVRKLERMRWKITKVLDVGGGPEEMLLVWGKDYYGMPNLAIGRKSLDGRGVNLWLYVLYQKIGLGVEGDEIASKRTEYPGRRET